MSCGGRPGPSLGSSERWSSTTPMTCWPRCASSCAGTASDVAAGMTSRTRPTASPTSPGPAAEDGLAGTGHGAGMPTPRCGLGAGHRLGPGPPEVPPPGRGPLLVTSRLDHARRPRGSPERRDPATGLTEGRSGRGPSSPFLWLPQTVADPGLARDVARSGRVVAKLAPDLRDHVAGVVAIADGVRPPDPPKQAVVGDRASGVEGQEAQDLVLSGGEVHGAAADRHLPVAEVDLEVPDP